MDAFRIPAKLEALSTLGLTRGQVARIENGRGKLVRVEHGSVWLTQAGELDDICLNAGDSFRIERDGSTLLSALRCTSFALVSIDSF